MNVGFVLVATKEKYLHMATSVVNRLRKIEGPGIFKIEIYVSTPLVSRAQSTLGEDVLVIEMPDACESFFDKVLALTRTKLDRVIYIDVDILYLRPIGHELIRALNYVDCCVQFGTSFNMRWEVEKYPVAVSQPNTGVIALNLQSHEVRSFLDKWLELGRSLPAPHDQPSFRAALLETSIRFSHLGPEYNYQGDGFLFYPPKIYHFASDRNHQRINDFKWISRIVEEIEASFSGGRNSVVLTVDWRVVACYSQESGHWRLC